MYIEWIPPQFQDMKQRTPPYSPYLNKKLWLLLRKKGRLPFCEVSPDLVFKELPFHFNSLCDNCTHNVLKTVA